MTEKNNDSRKMAAIFSLQGQMVETKAWKKLRVTEDQDRCRSSRSQRETVQHLLAEFKKLVGKEYTR